MGIIDDSIIGLPALFIVATIAGLNYAVYRFVPSPYTWYIYGVESVLYVALLVWAYLSVWINETIIVDKKQYKFFLGCANQQEAAFALHCIIARGYLAVISNKHSEYPCVYIRMIRKQPSIYPYEVIEYLKGNKQTN